MKVRNFLLKANTVLSAIVVFMELITFDIGKDTISVSCLVASIWLCLFLYANKERIKKIIGKAVEA